MNDIHELQPAVSVSHTMSIGMQLISSLSVHFPAIKEFLTLSHGNAGQSLNMFIRVDWFGLLMLLVYTDQELTTV